MDKIVVYQLQSYINTSHLASPMAAAFCPVGAFCRNSIFINPKPFHGAISHKSPITTQAISPSSSSTSYNNTQDTSLESMSVDALKRFIRLNLGNWTGSFHVSIVIHFNSSRYFAVNSCLCDYVLPQQFDSKGKLMHKIDTRISAGSYGENELISLIQT